MRHLHATAGRIRFTVVAVELREDAGDRWLALDYVTSVEGNCEKVFRVEALGFEATTRKTEFLVDNPGFAPVHHQRMEPLRHLRRRAGRWFCGREVKRWKRARP